jgi:hypothetical protein
MDLHQMSVTLGELVRAKSEAVERSRAVADQDDIGSRKQCLAPRRRD